MKSFRNTGFTLLEIMVVVAVIGLLAAIAIPNFLTARSSAQTNACIDNLRQIDGAIQQWALEQKQSQAAAVVYLDITPYLKGGLVCPAGGTQFSDSYTITTVSGVPQCLRVPATHRLTP